MVKPANTTALIAALWQKNKPIVEERIALLERLPASPSHLEREDALAAAHKLSGSLGMYGYPEASETASRIEHMLRHEPAMSIAPLIAALRLQLSTGN